MDRVLYSQDIRIRQFLGKLTLKVAESFQESLKPMLSSTSHDNEILNKLNKHLNFPSNAPIISKSTKFY